MLKKLEIWVDVLGVGDGGSSKCSGKSRIIIRCSARGEGGDNRGGRCVSGGVGNVHGGLVAPSRAEVMRKKGGASDELRGNAGDTRGTLRVVHGSTPFAGAQSPSMRFNDVGTRMTDAVAASGGGHPEPKTEVNRRRVRPTANTLRLRFTRRRWQSGRGGWRRRRRRGQ